MMPHGQLTVFFFLFKNLILIRKGPVFMTAKGEICAESADECKFTRLGCSSGVLSATKGEQ